jgi:hypothetical protein
MSLKKIGDTMRHRVPDFLEARAKKRWRGAIHRARCMLFGCGYAALRDLRIPDSFAFTLTTEVCHSIVIAVSLGDDRMGGYG